MGIRKDRLQNSVLKIEEIIKDFPNADCNIIREKFEASVTFKRLNDYEKSHIYEQNTVKRLLNAKRGSNKMNTENTNNIDEDEDDDKMVFPGIGNEEPDERIIANDKFLADEFEKVKKEMDAKNKANDNKTVTSDNDTEDDAEETEEDNEEELPVENIFVLKDKKMHTLNEPITVAVGEKEIVTNKLNIIVKKILSQDNTVINDLGKFINNHIKFILENPKELEAILKIDNKLRVAAVTMSGALGVYTNLNNLINHIDDNNKKAACNDFLNMNSVLKLNLNTDVLQSIIEYIMDNYLDDNTDNKSKSEAKGKEFTIIGESDDIEDSDLNTINSIEDFSANKIKEMIIASMNKAKKETVKIKEEKETEIIKPVVRPVMKEMKIDNNSSPHDIYTQMMQNIYI